MGNCCKSASISELTEVEIPEKKTLDQSSQTIKIIEVIYNEGPIGLKLQPDKNVVIVLELVSDNHYCGQTEMYNSMVSIEKQIKPNMHIREINRQCVLGHSYNEILEILRNPTRPLSIGFVE